MSDHTSTTVELGERLEGYVARPGSGPAPGIVVFMEAFGLTEHIRRVCDRLAGMGYVAVAPDIYHGATYAYADRENFLTHLKSMDDDVCMLEAGQALDWLAADDAVDEARLGAIGFCMGGRLAFLTAAAHAARINAAACMYGGGIAPEADRLGRTPLLDRIDEISGALYLGYGAEDGSIAPAEHGRIAAALSTALRRYTLDVFPEAGHGFMCEDRESYAPAATDKAWHTLENFFATALA